MKFHLLFSSFMFLSSFLVSSCGDKAPPAAPAAAPPVQVEIHVVKAEPFSSSVEASGTVIANELVELKPEMSGRIVQLNINEGARVESGTLLVKLNDEEYQAQLRKYKSQQDIAEKTRARLQKLLEANGLNQQEYDIAVSQVESLQADIDYTTAQIRKTEVRAPFSGIIGLRNVSMGAYITPTQIIATIQKTDNLKVDFVLPESKSDVLSEGAALEIVTGTGSKFKAKLLAIEPFVDQGTRNMKGRAIFTDDPGRLQPGAFVNVLIESHPNDSSILIPTQCIIPESRNKKVALIKNGKVKFQVVETGVRTETSAEILSGVSIGDSIATTGLLFLKPDAPVVIRQAQ